MAENNSLQTLIKSKSKAGEKIFSTILNDALKKKAESIHFCPNEDELILFYRQNKALKKIAKLPNTWHKILSQLLKKIANLDLQDNILQEGKFKIALNKKIQRFSVFFWPTVTQEKIILKLHKEEDLKSINPPTNVYGFSKLAGEYFCRSFQEQYGLPFVILRYHNIYGPGEDSKGSSPGDIHVVPALIEKVLRGQYPINLLGDPEATRPFTFIDDAVDATIKIVQEMMGGNSRVINNDFNIGTDSATKISDLAEIIWRLLGDGRPFRFIVEKTSAITAVRREMDATKVKEFIGWGPKVPLEEGILKTAEWIKNR